jgi:hypothetical protein
MINKFVLWIYKKCLYNLIRQQCEETFFMLFEQEVKENKPDTYSKEEFNINKSYLQSLKKNKVDTLG